MFCIKCGAQNADTAVRCAQCGEVLPAAVDQQSAPVQLGGAPYSPNPAVPYAPPGENLPAVNNYLVPAIGSTLCCCLPLGVVAIVYASQVNTKLGVGDYAGAVQASKSAKLWVMIAVGLGFVANLLAVGLQLLPVLLNH